MKRQTLNAMLIIGVAFFAACKGKSSQYEVYKTESDSLRSEQDSSSQSKLVKTASINFKVKDVEHTSEKIDSIVTVYNGMVMHHNVSSNIDQSKDFRLTNDSVMRVTSIRTIADLTVKIPSDKLETFMNTVSHLSIYVTDRKLDITDKSLDFLSDQLKLKSRTQIIAQQKAGKVVIKDPEAVLYLKDDMIDQRVNNLKIDDAVKYSVVDLHYFQSNRINKEIIANDDPSAYNISYFNRVGMAVQNGVVIFSELILGIVNLWMIILAGAIAWFGFRYYKRKHSKPILNNI